MQEVLFDSEQKELNLIELERETKSVEILKIPKLSAPYPNYQISSRKISFVLLKKNLK
jgi:hypothetical protein